jgi:hypothetical protein
MMQSFALGLALLLALGIIAIGSQYLASPLAAARVFGLPMPDGANIAWWLRLKGVRDIVLGLNVLAFMIWGAPNAVGMVLLVETVVPLGDMLLILAARGSTTRALGMHGVTALVMLLAAMPLAMGRA